MLTTRSVPSALFNALLADGVDPLSARVFATRGIQSRKDINNEIDALINPAELKGIDAACDLLESAIADHLNILVVADYDCDGATACAVAVRGLRMFGARVDYLVPNRREHGYGLTPPIVALALNHPRLGRPDLLVTVDNGIASHDGIEAARRAGLQVLVTDHHLPAATLPRAHAIVNPNQPGCGFPSKSLAGVGVMFYVLAALRARFRTRHPHHPGSQAKLADLLDLVALGTIADVVKLDENNRRLVQAGLKRLRLGRGCAGIRALMLHAGRDLLAITAADLGFTVGPRINAAGRLADLSQGIACLVTDDEDEAARLAAELDSINRERRSLQRAMSDQALDLVGASSSDRLCLVTSDTGWHEGVIGLVAGELKNRFNRPAFAFAPAADGVQWRGSGRSVPGVHLRDALDLVSKRAPTLIDRFGGHAMAAGLTLTGPVVATFSDVLDQVLRDTVDPALLQSTIVTDGELDPALLSAAWVQSLQDQVWGQGFPEPSFHFRLKTLSQRLVGERHLRIEVASGRHRLPAIAFGRTEPAPPEAVYVFRPALNDFRGQRSVQLVIEAILSADTI